jgi:hypothetical protein
MNNDPPEAELIVDVAPLRLFRNKLQLFNNKIDRIP